MEKTEKMLTLPDHAIVVSDVHFDVDEIEAGRVRRKVEPVSPTLEERLTALESGTQQED